MQIEKIKKQGKTYKITLNNGEVITTYDNVIIQNGLLYHKKINEKTLNKINTDTKYYEIYNKVRGLNSWPGAYAILNGKRIKIWECYMTDNYYTELVDGQITKIYKDGIGVKVGSGEVVITLLQMEGKNKMKALDFANGYGKDNLIGQILS